jgi:hypothetical protein
MNDRFLSLSRLFFLWLVVLIPFFSTAQSALDSLPPIDSLTDWQVNALAQQFAIQAKSFEQVLSEKSQTATTRRSSIEDDWKTLKADSTAAKIDIDSIAGLLKTAKSEEKNALRQQGQAAKTLELANKTVESDNITQRKNLRRLWKEVRQLNAFIHPVEPTQKTEPLPAPVKPTTEETPLPVAKRAPVPVYQKYDPTGDVMLHPPALPCRMAVKTRDEFSGEIYRRTVGVELFRQTPPALKNYLQGKPNVQCDAALAASGPSTALHLTFTIHDPNPRKAFGKLEKGSVATLWFMDGSSFNVYNQQVEEGVLNPETEAFTIQAQYPLPADILKKIRRTELDKIRITWSSGYEDYDVQYVMLLLEQAKCLFD